MGGWAALARLARALAQMMLSLLSVSLSESWGTQRHRGLAATEIPPQKVPLPCTVVAVI